MTDERQLHCFTNGTDTVSAYSVEDALPLIVYEYDARTYVSDGEIDQVPDDEVIAVHSDDPSDLPVVSKTAREWASQGRGLVCSTEW